MLWSSYTQDGSGQAVLAKLFDTDFNGIGDEFVVNATTAGHQNPEDVVNTEDGFIVF